MLEAQMQNPPAQASLDGVLGPLASEHSKTSQKPCFYFFPLLNVQSTLLGLKPLPQN